MKQLDHMRDLAKRVELDAPPNVDLVRHMAAAAAVGEEGALQKRLAEATSGPGKLSENEFFYYQLYDPTIPFEELHKFVGKVQQNNLHKQCNSPLWLASVMDKSLFELVMRGAGFRTIQSLAICTNREKGGFANNLRSATDLRSFLIQSSAPLFAKPIDGMYSIGCMALTNATLNSVEINYEFSVSYDDLWRYFNSISRSGYLIQEYLSHSKQMKERLGQELCTIRCLVLYEGEPRVECASIKIATNGAVADNFWRTGNLLAPVNLESGQIAYAVARRELGFQAIDVHPETGLKFSEIHLDMWPAALQLVRDASTLFPGIRTQSWDVALTNDGPVIVELNWGGDLNLHQLAHRKGALTSSFAAHILKCDGGRLIGKTAESNQ